MKIVRRSVSILLFTAMILPLLLTGPAPSPVFAEEFSETETAEAYGLLLSSMGYDALFYQYYRGSEAALSDSDVPESRYQPADGVNSAGYEDTISYNVEAPADGFYQITADYRTASGAMNNLTLSLTVDGETPFREAQTLDVPLIWKDESKTFTLDSYGDESLPNQLRVDEWRELSLHNNIYSTTRPLEIYLEAGTHEIAFQNLSADDLELGELRLGGLADTVSYSDYRSGLTEVSGSDPSIAASVNAISYIEKNSSFVRLAGLKNPAVEPYDPIDRKINIIDAGGWNKAGQSITYEFEVPAEGDYELSFHYLNDKDEFNVFRTLSIDGEVPFREFYDYEFPYTNNRWTNLTLADPEDEPYRLRLAAGRHTLTLTATQGLVAPSVDSLQILIDHINQFALEIRKITGKDVDRNRTWRLTSYLPETEDYLDAYEIVISDIVSELSAYAPNGSRSATLSFLGKALRKLDIMQEKPDELPLYFEDLYSGTGSVTQMLGDTIDRLNNAGMALDMIYVSQGSPELPRQGASLFSRAWGSVQSFLSTFTSDKYIIRNDEQAVNVWVSRPITYVDIMQKLVDAKFTPSTGIKVKLSVMPDANKLILSNASGEAPDVALGLPSYMPYDIAIRGAGYPLSDFPDFWEVARQSTPGAYIPYVFNDKVYALPETLDFQALIYRKDVFDSLGLTVPSSWDEIVGMLPTLQRYGMNFYHTIAGGTSTKWFYQTSPLIYQNNGTLYEKDGYYSAIDEAQAVLGLTQLAELFTTYSLPVQVPNFYNSFRYNQLPIGMVDFNTYLQVLNAAPELKGQWELADYPGIRQEDGSVSRWFISNGTGAVIMEKAPKPDEAWEFLKWWSSAPTQTEYANVLSSTYGPQYVWLSGNLEAAANAPIPAQDKAVILRQIPWLRDVPRTPGQYMLERGLSDIWSQAVQDGIYPRVAIDQQMIVINREIRRKMLEFGFINADGSEIRPYTVRDIDWIQEQMDQAAGSALNASPARPDNAKE